MSQPQRTPLFEPFAERQEGARRPLDVRIEHARETDFTAIATLIARREGVPIGGARNRITALLDDAPRERELFVARARATPVEAATPASPVAEAHTRASALTPMRERDGSAATELTGYAWIGRLDRKTIPAGWYLTGVQVAPECRRRGVGEALTKHRIEILLERTDSIWYFANVRNAVSIELHHALGFREVRRHIVVPGCPFTGGVGALFHLHARDYPTR